MKSNFVESVSKSESKRGRLKKDSLEFVLKHAVQPGRERKLLRRTVQNLQSRPVTVSLATMQSGIVQATV